MTRCAGFTQGTLLPAPALHSVLALDLGWNTGWAKISASGALRVGTYRTPAEPGAQDLRFAHWLAWLSELTRKPSGAIYYEKAYQRGHQAARVYGGLETLLLTRALALNLRAVGIAASTIKKAATENGTTGKLKMIEAARQVLRTQGDDRTLDDKADDAICLLLQVPRVACSLRAVACG